MVVKFDSLNKLEVPQFTLCNPGSKCVDGLLTKSIGMLSNTEAESFTYNFNSSSELNFRINKPVKGSVPDEELSHAENIFNAVQKRRLLFVDGVGYFCISDIQDHTEGNRRYKDVTAISADHELSLKQVPYIEDGTYRFLGTTSNAGLFNMIVDSLPIWTMGTVDGSVASKHRTFEDVDLNMNCLAFLIENMQDAYECIFIFDIINRKINVYSQDNYVVKTNVHLTKDDMAKEIEVKESSEDLYTALSVFGEDEVTIAAVNPTGSTVIYDFSHYTDWMSNELRNKVLAWQQAVSAAETNYYNKSREYFEKKKQKSDCEKEIERLEILADTYKKCKDNIVAEKATELTKERLTVIVGQYKVVIDKNNGTQIPTATVDNTIAALSTFITSTNNSIATEKSRKTTIESSLAPINNELESIRNSLKINNYFSSELREELMNYIYEGTYTDEYVKITDIMTYEEKFEQMHTLYNRAKEQLKKVSRPTQEFTINTESFVFEKSFEKASSQLETGCLINVELDRDDIAELFLSSIEIDYEDRNMRLTFGNRFNKFDIKSLFGNMLGKISKSANTINYIKDILYPIKQGELNKVKEALQSSRDLTMQNALGATDEQVTIDSSGYTGKRKLSDGNFDDKQIKITSNSMVFTKDNWDTCELAIGNVALDDGTSMYGINAKTIIGDLIIGNQIRVLDNSSNELFTAADGGVNININEITTATNYKFDANGLRIKRSDSDVGSVVDNTGLKVTREYAGIGSENVLSATNEGVDALNLKCTLYLDVGKNCRFEDYLENRTACFYIGS